MGSFAHAARGGRGITVGDGARGYPLWVDLVFHLTTEQAWAEARSQGTYAPASLASEGFIHASWRDQVLAVANCFLRGQADLVVLHIDPSRLRVPLRVEAATPGGEAYPHIYGSFDPAAVVGVSPLVLQADGKFAWGA